MGLPFVKGRWGEPIASREGDTTAPGNLPELSAYWQLAKKNKKVSQKLSNLGMSTDPESYRNDWPDYFTSVLNKGTVGDMFMVKGPNGKSWMAPQLDVGPAEWVTEKKWHKFNGKWTKGSGAEIDLSDAFAKKVGVNGLGNVSYMKVPIAPKSQYLYGDDNNNLYEGPGGRIYAIPKGERVREGFKLIFPRENIFKRR